MFNKSFWNYSRVIGIALLAGGVMKMVGFSEKPAPAQEDSQQCVIPGYLLQNKANYSYNIGDAATQINDDTNSLQVAVVNGNLGLVNPAGINDGQGNQVVGAFSGALADELIKLGFTAEQASTAVLAVILRLSQMPIDSSFREMAIAGREAIAQAVPAQAETVFGLDRQTAQETALVVLASVSKSILLSSGFTEAEAETAIAQGIATLGESVDSTPVNQAFDAVYQTAVGAVPTQEATLTQMRQDFIAEMQAIRDGVRQSASQGDLLYFDFQISNPSDRAVRFQIPDASAIEPLTSGGQVNGVSYSWVNTGNGSFLIGDCPTPVPEEPEEPTSEEPIVLPEQPLPGGETEESTTEEPTTEEPTAGGPTAGAPTAPPSQPSTGIILPDSPLEGSLPAQPETIPVTEPTEVVIPPGGEINMTVEVEVGPVGEEGSGITVAIPESETQEPVAQQTLIIPPVLRERLRDPLGQVTGCAGEVLSDYTGFQVALFEADPADPTGGVTGLLPLTPTELPDRPDNNIPEGLAPNIENANPFFLTNGEFGVYNFLLDATRGQLDVGRVYILVVTPPPGSIFNERRIRIEIIERTADRVVYIATSLDGRSISATDGSTSVRGSIAIQDGERVGLSLAVLDLSASICEAQEIEITKTGDRIVTAPGDTVIYRLAIRNLSSAPINNLTITDRLPLGLQFRDDSVRGAISETPQAISSRHNGRDITFNAAEISLPSGETLNIAYAARVTPDALRGNGRNSATVNGQRIDNGGIVKDGPAVHRLRLDPGILSDCGTLIGRVFEDLNFDGEQQDGEPGIPNAIIFMDDGNRIITDENGLFSVANVLPGYRTGTLDLTSTPGYDLAPNDLVNERNSVTRLVKLSPGGLAKMNFAVIGNGEQETGLGE